MTTKINNSLDEAYSYLGVEYLESDHEYQMMALRSELSEFLGAHLSGLTRLIRKIKP